ncbi:hypothetical protein CALCODRAFT_486678 [Calocera cornea HHB12733]|uniref:Uncharacterized protein n=1 Tax=Calocera cornea HHB12733 TaxID=1353952 RepID=A0A165DKZ8_9BASI|nr:hypothetical protein CALCODRAFT_486678 [Calocera cornea HHB12733]
MQLTLLLSFVVLSVVGVSAQSPVPGKILSPGNGMHYRIGQFIPFAYNYTKAAEHLTTLPLIDVYVSKAGDAQYTQVAKGLSCSPQTCPHGILAQGITLSDYEALTGIGAFEMFAAQEESSEVGVNVDSIVPDTITGAVSFRVEPLP